MIFNPVQSINEVYFGKTKEIQAIENALDHFRQKYMGKFMVMKINSDPELLAINRMFEKEFGFGCFSLTIDNRLSVNAFTAPIDYRIDVQSTKQNDRILASKTGFKFDPKLDYCCMVHIYSGLIFNEAYTTDEIMAIILHEIGHNFYASLDKKHGILSGMYKSLIWLSIVFGNIQLLFTQSNTIDNVVTKTIQDLRSRGSLITDVIDIFRHALSLFNMVKSGAMYLLNLLSFNMLTALGGLLVVFNKFQNPLTLIMLPMRHGDERQADNFATMYGYGPAAASAFRKMEEHKSDPNKINNELNKIPYLAALFNMVALPSEILLYNFDEHSHGISRAKDQLDLLEREIRKEDLDPKLKKYIQLDIDAINKQMDRLIDTSKGMKDPDIAQHCYNRILFNLTGDKSVKDRLLDDRYKFEVYDKTFYDRLGKS